MPLYIFFSSLSLGLSLFFESSHIQGSARQQHSHMALCPLRYKRRGRSRAVKHHVERERRQERSESVGRRTTTLSSFFCAPMLFEVRGKKRRRRLFLDSSHNSSFSTQRSFRSFFSSFSHHGEVRPGPDQRVQELQGSRQVRRK